MHSEDTAKVSITVIGIVGEAPIVQLILDGTVVVDRDATAKTMSLERTILLQCIRPCVGARAQDHHGNPRTSDFITGHASKGYWGHQFSDALERPFLHFFCFSRRRAISVEADEVERVLADVDADRCNGFKVTGVVWHGMLLILVAPNQLCGWAGQEHGGSMP
jgi:hypothetical protein